MVFFYLWRNFVYFIFFFSSYFLPVRIIFFFFWASHFDSLLLLRTCCMKFCRMNESKKKTAMDFFFSIINKIYISILYLNSLQLCIVVSYLAIIINWQISWNFTKLIFLPACIFLLFYFKKKFNMQKKEKKINYRDIG